MERLAERRREDHDEDVLRSLHPLVSSIVKSRGWTRLTPVQEKAIPVILSGANTLVMAPTGEGKTEAALLPLLSLMLEGASEPVTLLYVTPMKALINDLYNRVRALAEPLGFRVARKHGDTPARERSRRHRNAPHILITTPESLEIDLDWAPRFRGHYENLRFVVVDEVHEFMSGKRGAQLVFQLERLRRLSRHDLQVVALSATVGDPERVISLLSGTSRRPRAIVNAGAKKKPLFAVELVGEGGDPWGRLAARIAEIAKVFKPILVFVNSRFAAEQVKTALEELGVEDVFVHHSSVSAEIREEAEEKLRRGEISAIVCTKTLEVGIDVGEINAVVQVKAPGRVSSLLQRVGRSGHRIGGTPRGFILSTDKHDAMESLATAVLAREGRVEGVALSRMPLDVVARQLLGIILAEKEIRLSKFLDLVKGLEESVGLGLDYESIRRMIEYMAQTKIIKVSDGDDPVLRIGPTFYKIWRFRGDNGQRAWWSRSFSEFFSMITERDSFTVKHGDKTIGMIDSLFVYRHLRVGDVIRLAGRSWRIKRIDDNLGRVDVEPASGEAEIPIWRGEGPRRSRIIAEALAHLISKRLPVDVEVDDKVSLTLNEWRRVYEKVLMGRDASRVLVYERYGDDHVFTAMLGSGAAEVLAMAVTHLASKKTGLNVRYRAAYTGFSVYVGDLNPLELLLSIDPEELPRIVEVALDRSPYLYQTVRDIQLSFGRVGSPDPEEDGFLFEEAKRQVLEEYLDVDTAVEFLKALKRGEIEVVAPMIPGITPIAREIIQSPSVRPWLPDLAMRIARALEGSSLTVIDIADILELAEKTVESKLKEMRKPEYGDLRVVSFIDSDTGEVMWALLKDLHELASLEEFEDIFSPRRLDEPLRLYIRSAPGQKPVEIIVKPSDMLDGAERVLSRLPKEMYSVKIISAYDHEGRDDLSVVHYYVPREALPLLVLNAAKYIETKYYEEFF